MNRQEAEEILKSEDPNISPLRAIGFLQGSDSERKRAEKLVLAMSYLTGIGNEESKIFAREALSEWKKGE